MCDCVSKLVLVAKSTRTLTFARLFPTPIIGVLTGARVAPIIGTCNDIKRTIGKRAMFWIDGNLLARRDDLIINVNFPNWKHLP